MALALIDKANLNLDESKLEVQDIEMASLYWTPEKEGEYKIVIFLGVERREIFSEETGELTDTKTVVNMVASINGAMTQIENASKRLVGIFNNEIFQPGMKFKVTYLGKKISRESGYKYDDWSVKPVVERG